MNKPPSLFRSDSWLRALNLLPGVFGYAVAVVEPTGRKPELVGTVEVTVVEVVVVKESTSVEVLVTNAVAVLVVTTVDVVEKVSVTVLAVVVTMI